jgi:hypothetical protein
MIFQGVSLCNKHTIYNSLIKTPVSNTFILSPTIGDKTGGTPIIISALVTTFGKAPLWQCRSQQQKSNFFQNLRNQAGMLPELASTFASAV